MFAHSSRFFSLEVNLSFGQVELNYIAAAYHPARKQPPSGSAGVDHHGQAGSQ